MYAIHGAVANAATWIPLRRSLGDAADVLAYDLPGHGTRRSEAFALAPAIAELSERIGAEVRRRPTVVVGDSLGGYLALAVAARLGAGLCGVVAGSATFPMRGVAAAFARATLLADPLIPAALFGTLLRRACAPDVAAEILRLGLAPRMRAATLRALLGYDILGDVSAITVPIVFLNGSLDVPIVNGTERFVRAGRSARAVVVPLAPHGVGLFRPDVFARAASELFAASA